MGFHRWNILFVLWKSEGELVINWIKRINTWFLEIDYRAGADPSSLTWKLTFLAVLIWGGFLGISLCKVLATFSVSWLIVSLLLLAIMLWSQIGEWASEWICSVKA